MFDIIVNGNVVAVVVQQLVKPFVETLVKMLPDTMSIQTKEHMEEPTAETEAKKSK